MNKKMTKIAMVVCLVLVVTAGLALAQRRGSTGQRGGAGGAGGVGGAGMRQPRAGAQQGRGGAQQGGMAMRDPEQMRAMMMQRLRMQLGATDEQWTTLGPRLERVMELNRQMSGPRGGMFGGPGQMGGRFGGPAGQRGPRGPQAGAAAGPQPEATGELTAVEKATQELQNSLNAEKPDAAQVKTRLTALRQAKEKTKQDLAKAQTELKQGLNINQEATLVLWGYLD